MSDSSLQEETLPIIKPAIWRRQYREESAQQRTWDFITRCVRDLRIRIPETQEGVPLGARCRYCGGGEYLAVDHVVPRCQGGGDELSNLVVACKSCNSRKGGRTPEQAGMVLL